MNKPEETKTMKAVSVITFCIWLMFVLAMMGN